MSLNLNSSFNFPFESERSEVPWIDVFAILRILGGFVSLGWIRTYFYRCCPRVTEDFLRALSAEKGFRFLKVFEPLQWFCEASRSKGVLCAVNRSIRDLHSPTDDVCSYPPGVVCYRGLKDLLRPFPAHSPKGDCKWTGHMLSVWGGRSLLLQFWCWSIQGTLDLLISAGSWPEHILFNNFFVDSQSPLKKKPNMSIW